MDYSHLSDHEIKALLMQYDSELRRLNFQMQVVQNTIQQLHQQLAGVNTNNMQVTPPIVNPPVTTPPIQSEAVKEQAEEAPKQKEKKQKKEKKKKRKYTKNSPWPGFILEQFAKYGHVLSSGQLYDFGIEENMLREHGLENKEVRTMISRALHKLANVQKKLAKLPLEDAKGYNYAPVDWLNEDGKLEDKYKA